MTVFTAEDFTKFMGLAQAIEDEGIRNNACSLIERMNEVIEGTGDQPILWQPTIIKVLQSMSNMDNVTDGGAPVSAGSLVAGSHTIPNGLQVIPLNIWQSRSLWNPDKDSTNRLCSSPDAKLGWKHGNCYDCALGTSKEEGKPPACNKEYSFMVIAEDLSDMFRLTFAKSQYRSGMDWQKEVVNSRTHPYKRVYSLSGDSSVKNKKIKEVKAKLLGPTASRDLPYVTEAYMAFITALYEKQTSDRKAYLLAYHEETNKRLISRHNSETGQAIEDYSHGAEGGAPAEGEVATTGGYAF